METIDPTTGQPLPPDAIQRVLYIASKVHVYQIPPMATTKGHMAASWTENDPEEKRRIFTGRLRLLETAVPKPAPPSSSSPAADDDANEDIKVDLLLEDATSGELFAAAPYTKPATIEQALDSGRFFAIQVVSGVHKAMLGLGFLQRSEAMDFNIALQDARKVLGMEPNHANGGHNGSRGASSAAQQAEEKKDWSLKEGQTITVNINGRGSRRREPSGGDGGGGQADAKAALFSIKPPPASGGGGGNGPAPFLPPPPSASSVKAERRRSRPLPPQGQLPPAEKQPNPKELGFDDGEFGEFQ